MIVRNIKFFTLKKWVTHNIERPSIARACGNTILEYTVSGFLVLAVCVGVLMSVGKQLNTHFVDLKKDMKRHQALAIQAKVEANLQKYSLGTKEVIDNYFGEMNTAEGIILQRNLPGKLQTLGANGTTKLLSKYIAILANSLYEKGEITEEQRQTLLKLANKGHDMAYVERLVEDFVDLAGDRRKEFSNQTYEFQGKKYTPMELVQLVGYVKSYPSDVLKETPGGGALLTDFQRLYQEANNNGSLSNAAMKSLVMAAAAQIVMTGELMENSYYHYETGHFRFKNKSDMMNQVASDATNLHSSHICTAGHNIDGGTFCK